MARTTNTGCRCRVPLSDAPVPTMLSQGLMVQWCEERGVALELDHMNRLSISLDDAYRLRAEANKRAEENARIEAERAERLRRDIAKAQERRQEVYLKAFLKYERTEGRIDALGLAQKELDKAEASLDPSVRAQLQPARIPAQQMPSPTAGMAQPY
ncbi:hypothetical protein [Nocardioides panzhihuensis]|uniref:Uncharacterized protein n=1 Tax=Nocardioides panzhihuensis TaxID=860243 RepID=A0A7Z0ITB3_9ACTN|nr:hypothetical protein [Nocardioides panzhihuensis]NYI78740.1 hypothetical protein [Nocardioides panzhihuensis]